MNRTYRIRLDLAAALAAPEHCPECGLTGLAPAADGEQMRYRCASCDREWCVEFGRVIPCTPSSPRDTTGSGPERSSRCGSD